MNWREPDIPVRYRKLYEQGRNGKAKAAIRAMCGMCVGWEPGEVERCTATGCPLYNLRNKAAQAKTERLVGWSKGVQILCPRGHGQTGPSRRGGE